MPTYEYECMKCGHIFEVFQSITADPVKVCPKCNGKVKKLISPGIGLIFKGSGFYITDYKNNRNKSKSSQQVKSKSSGKNGGAQDNASTKSSKDNKKTDDKKKNKS